MGKQGAMVLGPHKIYNRNRDREESWELYQLDDDPTESKDLSKEEPELRARLVKQYLEWSASVDGSVAGKDYPEGKVTPEPPGNTCWSTLPEYQKHFGGMAPAPRIPGPSREGGKGSQKALNLNPSGTGSRGGGRKGMSPGMAGENAQG